MTLQPAARLGDPVAHTMAMPGALTGLLVGAAVGIAIVATGGLGAIAIGAALATTGGLGMAGQYIGESVMGPPTGAIITGSPNVLINGRPAARATLSLASCAKEYGVPQPEATGAATVFINGMPAGRKTEKIMCSAIIIDGSPDVLIGGPSAQTMPLNPEVPAWLSTTMQIMAIGGTIIATGGVAATYGVGVAVGGLAGGMIGGHYGGQLGGHIATSMGYGETVKRVGEVLGGIGGGAVGGGIGARGGRAFDNHYQIRSEGIGSNLGNVKIVKRTPNTRIRGSDGRFIRNNSTSSSRFNRKSEYPSGYRSGVKNQVLKNNTIKNGPNAGKIRTVDGDIVARNDPRLTIEHNKPVVEHWNETGYNSTRSVRNDFYNDTSNMSPRLSSPNSSDGGRMSAQGIRYRQDIGTNYGK